MTEGVTPFVAAAQNGAGPAAEETIQLIMNTRHALQGSLALEIGFGILAVGSAVAAFTLHRFRYDIMNVTIPS